MAPSTTRRALMLAYAVPATAAAPGHSLAAIWANAGAYRDAINAHEYDADPDGRLDADAARQGELELQVLTGPILSRADAAAKVRCAAQSFHDGDLACGSDWRALEQVARWLEALS